MVVLGKDERVKFENDRDNFTKEVQSVFLFCNRRKIGILVSRLRFPRKRRFQILFGLRSLAKTAEAEGFKELAEKFRMVGEIVPFILVSF